MDFPPVSASEIDIPEIVAEVEITSQGYAHTVCRRAPGQAALRRSDTEMNEGRGREANVV